MSKKKNPITYFSTYNILDRTVVSFKSIEEFLKCKKRFEGV